MLKKGRLTTIAVVACLAAVLGQGPIDPNAPSCNDATHDLNPGAPVGSTSYTTNRAAADVYEADGWEIIYFDPCEFSRRELARRALAQSTSISISSSGPGSGSGTGVGSSGGDPSGGDCDPYDDDLYYPAITLGFPFVIEGVDVDGAIYVGSNSYITFGEGSTAFSSLPRVPAMLVGGNDREAWFIAMKRDPDSVVIRFEGNTWPAPKDEAPDIIWEATFSRDNTIRVHSIADPMSQPDFSAIYNGRNAFIAEGKWGVGTAWTYFDLAAVCDIADNPDTPDTPNTPFSCFIPIQTVTGPEGRVLPPTSLLESGGALTYVNPNWHYADTPRMPGMPGDEPERVWEGRSATRNSHQRRAAKQTYQDRLAEMDKVKSMNVHDKETALAKVTKVVSAYQAAKSRVAQAAGLRPRSSQHTRAKRHEDSSSKQETRWASKDTAHPSEYPFMVSISHTLSYSDHMCDGTLIAPRFVLTSAVCLLQLSPSTAMGDGMLLEAAIGGEYHAVARVHMHPLFSTTQSLVDYNVAVIELSSDSMHPPIPLYEGGDIMRDCAPDLLAVGWDKNWMMKESESLLLVDQEQCGEAVPFLSDMSMCVLERSMPKPSESPMEPSSMPIPSSMPMPSSLFSTQPLMPTLEARRTMHGEGSMSGSGSGSGYGPGMQFYDCVFSEGGPLLLRAENDVGFVQVGVLSFSYCMDGMAPMAQRLPDMYARVSAMTGWIYTIPGLGSASMYAETEVNVEFNLLPGMAVRLWNLAPGQDTLAPLGLGEPSEDRRIDMIVGETMEPGEAHCGMSNHRTYFIPGGAPFAIDVTLCMDGPGSCGPIVLDKPPFVVKYGRAMSMMGGGCSVDMREFSMKHMIRHKKTGSLFQGGLAHTGLPPRMPAPTPMPFDLLLMSSPSPSASWACMRDWSTQDQKMCGIARHELACFGVDEHYEFHYAGPNSMREFVSMEDYHMGLQKGMMYALHGERVMADLMVAPFIENVGGCFLVAILFNPELFGGLFGGEPWRLQREGPRASMAF